MVTKKCIKCKKNRAIKYFSKNNHAIDGLYSYCKDCCKIERENKKEELKKYMHDYNIKNNKELKIKKKAYRKANKEQLKQYYLDNKEKILKRQNELLNQKLKNDPLFKFKHSIRSNIKEAIKRKGHKKITKTEKILGCTFDEFRQYIQTQFKKGMSFENHGKWELDHIIPISSAKTEEEVIKLCHYTNFQPLWKHENRIKSNKIIHEKQLKLL